MDDFERYHNHMNNLMRQDMEEYEDAARERRERFAQWLKEFGDKLNQGERNVVSSTKAE